jgi:copper transport protein
MAISKWSRGAYLRLLSQIRHVVLAATALATCGALLVAAPASAHAIVEETEPAIDQVVDESPARVVMGFSEPVEIAFGAIRVYNTDAQRVDQGETTHIEGRADAIAVHLEPDLPDGTYTAAWRVVSADGHPITEAFVFHVGKPGLHPQGIADRVLGDTEGSTLASILFGITRWLNFAALLTLVGAGIFLVCIWEATGNVRAPPPGAEERFRRRWRTMAYASWAALVVTTGAGLVLQGAVAGGVSLPEAFSGSVVSDVLDTRYGTVGLFKAGLLVAIAGLWALAGRSVSYRLQARSVGAAAVNTSVPRVVTAAGGALFVLLLATPGMAGHAGTTDPVWINLVVDDLHLIAAAAWVGGLATLLVAGFASTKGLADHDAVRTLGLVVTRFSNMAMIAVAVIVATGIYRGWEEVGAFRALTDATYGWVFLTKLAVFLPLIALGAVNNRWTKPRVRKAMQQSTPTAAPLNALRRLVAVEVVLAAIVLAVTALLVNLAPARIEAGVSGPFMTDVKLGPFDLDVLVDPNQVGANEVHLTATEPSGLPAEIREMKVLFTMPSEGIGPIVGKGRRLAPGHFVVQGRQLSVPGNWTLEIVGRTGRFDDERTRVQLTVND